MSKTTNDFAPEVRERAVRFVFDNEGRHGSRWLAILSIAASVGGSAHTLNAWVKKADVESGKRAHPDRDGRAVDSVGTRTAPA